MPNPCVPAAAAGLPSPTRRTALQILAAAPFAAVPAAAAPNPDAGLFAAIAEHGRAVAASAPFHEVYEALDEQHRQACPPRPDALRWRSHDLLGTGSEAERPGDRPHRSWYGAAQVETMRGLPPVTRWEAVEGDHCVRVPDPEGQARLRSIIAAHDAWQAECDAIAERIGLTKAEADMHAVFVAVDAIEAAIMETTPATVAGLAAKARWAKASGVDFEDWAARIVADVLAVAGRVA